MRRRLFSRAGQYHQWIDGNLTRRVKVRNMILSLSSVHKCQHMYFYFTYFDKFALYSNKVVWKGSLELCSVFNSIWLPMLPVGNWKVEQMFSALVKLPTPVLRKRCMQLVTVPLSAPANPRYFESSIQLRTWSNLLSLRADPDTNITIGASVSSWVGTDHFLILKQQCRLTK